NPEQRLRIAETERPQQNGVNDRKCGQGRADAQGRVKNGTAKNAGDFLNVRALKRTSWITLSIQFPPSSSRHSALKRSVLPNSIRAWRSASAAFNPERSSAARRNSRCARSSSASSLSILARWKNLRPNERR